MPELTPPARRPVILRVGAFSNRHFHYTFTPALTHNRSSFDRLGIHGAASPSVCLIRIRLLRHHPSTPIHLTLASTFLFTPASQWPARCAGHWLAGILFSRSGITVDPLAVIVNQGNGLRFLKSQRDRCHYSCFATCQSGRWPMIAALQTPVIFALNPVLPPDHVGWRNTNTHPQPAPIRQE